MALSTLSSTVRSKFKNTVGDYEISYEATHQEGQSVTEVIASVKKGELKFGYINIAQNGRKSIVLEAGISDEDSKQLFSTVVDDTKSIFESKNV